MITQMHIAWERFLIYLIIFSLFGIISPQLILKKVCHDVLLLLLSGTTYLEKKLNLSQSH